MLSGSEVALELVSALTASVAAGAGDLAQQAAQALSCDDGILAPYSVCFAAVRAPGAKRSRSVVYTEAPLLSAAVALESWAAAATGALLSLVEHVARA